MCERAKIAHVKNKTIYTMQDTCCHKTKSVISKNSTRMFHARFGKMGIYIVIMTLYPLEPNAKGQGVL